MLEIEMPEILVFVQMRETHQIASLIHFIQLISVENLKIIIIIIF